MAELTGEKLGADWEKRRRWRAQARWGIRMISYQRARLNKNIIRNHEKRHSLGGLGFIPWPPVRLKIRGQNRLLRIRGDIPLFPAPLQGGRGQRKHWHSPKRTNRNWSIHTFGQNVSKSPTPRPAHTGKWSGLIAKESKKLDRIQKAIQRSEVFKNVFDEDWVAFWWLILIDFLIDFPPPGVETFNSSLFAPPNSKLKLLSKIYTCLIPIFFIFENVSRWNVHFWVSFTSDKNMAKSMVKYGC